MTRMNDWIRENIQFSTTEYRNHTADVNGDGSMIVSQLIIGDRTVDYYVMLPKGFPPSFTYDV